MTTTPQPCVERDVTRPAEHPDARRGTATLCFVDVETTGLRPVERYAVIQIAGIVCELDLEARVVREMLSFDFNVRPFPNDVIEESALAVSGKAISDLQEYAAPAVIQERLGRLLDPIVLHCGKMFFQAYNAGFDFDHVRAWLKKDDHEGFKKWFWSPAHDVMTLAAEYLMPERHTMPDFKLATVAKKLGIPHEHAHDAASDVRTTMKIYARCSRHGLLRCVAGRETTETPR